MKKFMYVVTFLDGTMAVGQVEENNVLDVHYRIYREFGRGYESACVKEVKGK